jgi:hypothetical protein
VIDSPTITTMIRSPRDHRALNYTAGNGRAPRPARPVLNPLFQNPASAQGDTSDCCRSGKQRLSMIGNLV